jgi:hypothetical protein
MVNERYRRQSGIYIFSHPEFRDELEEIFDEVLASLPEGEAPAGLVVD